MDLGALYGAFDRYLLVLVRVMALLGATPFFGSRVIPFRLKISLGLVTAFLLLPLAKGPLPGVAWSSPGTYAAAVASEMLMGLALGFAVTLSFMALQMAGTLIDIPIGFSMVNVLDPLLTQNVPLIGQFQYVLFMLMFLAVNGHHYLLQALAKTFEMVPLGGFRYFPTLSQLILKWFTETFTLGFKISLPVVAALFLTDVALGLVARAVPQMNVFVVGFPAKIAVGLAFVMLALPVYVQFVDLTFNPHGDLYSLVQAILKGGAPVGP